MLDTILFVALVSYRWRMSLHHPFNLDDIQSLWLHDVWLSATILNCVAPLFA
jgi:hypothetical protein